jgi:hypothetical protein
MNSEYEYLLRGVEFRIIEKRTPVIERLVSGLGLSLVSVECTPLQWCIRKRCFVNVDEQVRRAGGTLLTGWLLNEYRGRTIQGEAHGIWISKFGKRFDITPHDFQPKRILFAPDPMVAEKRGYTAGPKLILSTDPRVIAMEQFDSSLEELFQNAFVGFGKEMAIPGRAVAEAADAVGLPHDVAKHILDARITARASN